MEINGIPDAQREQWLDNNYSPDRKILEWACKMGGLDMGFNPLDLLNLPLGKLCYIIEISAGVIDERIRHLRSKK